MTADVPPYPQPYGYPPGPPKFDVGKAFAWAWAKFRANTPTLVLGTILILIAVIAMYAVAIFVVFAIVDHPTLTLTDSHTGKFTHVGSYFATIGVAEGTLFVLAIPLAVLSAGLLRTALLIADGGSPRIREAFRVPHPLRVMATSTMISICTLIGFVLCYLPGLVVATFCGFAIAFVVDHGQSPVPAIRSSVNLVKENFGNTLLVIVLGGAVATAGLFVCIVGLLVSAPLAMLVHVYTYRFFSHGTIATA
jgi:uncharacterized membrane protein